VALRAEGVVSVSYGVVFLPLWLWNLLVLAGAVSGIMVWILKKRRREEREHLYHLKGLILSPLLQFPIFLAELLVAVNLDTGDHQWRAVFTPLYLLPLLYIPPCIWGCFRKRNVDLELLGIFSLVQVIFLGIKMDRVVVWKWALVFIPTYLLLVAFVTGWGIYASYLLYLHLYSPTSTPHELQTRRMADVLRLVSSLAIWFCTTVFIGLLVAKLDGQLTSSYPAIFTPLYLALFLLLTTSFTRRPANPWWFGAHKPFSTFVLDALPFLRAYANISIIPEDDDIARNSFAVDAVREKKKSKNKQRDENLTIPSDLYPLEDIYTPD
jgi:hypothetical protein